MMRTAITTDSAQTFRAKAERWAPGLRVARTYQTAWLPRDLVAGLVLSALLVPQVMAYAELAGLPAITGLYATVVCLLAYAVFGPSPYLVLEGIVIAVVLSILQFFRRAWQSYYAVLGKTQDAAGYHDLERHPDGEQIPGLLMLRWDSPLFFANANIFRKLIREQIAATTSTPLWVLVAAEPITDVDSTAVDMLVDLDEELKAKGIHLVMARTAAVVGTATATRNAVNRRQADKNVAAYSNAVEHAQAEQAPPPEEYYEEPLPAQEDDVITQLERLGALKGQGILSEEEFAAQKAKLLGT
ncbi:MAG: hypothetical protein AMJ56_06875 [Anaerolineae bacterium SG8_19]|jgi:MFS superfamily sulfate permease-like transporter|nr:MAG: hypothetical protein AMJ56_06875 [Anaerolineae bacterium SG8_19]